jgi:hypothetical protein
MEIRRLSLTEAQEHASSLNWARKDCIAEVQSYDHGIVDGCRVDVHRYYAVIRDYKVAQVIVDRDLYPVAAKLQDKLKRFLGWSREAENLYPAGVWTLVYYTGTLHPDRLDAVHPLLVECHIRLERTVRTIAADGTLLHNQTMRNKPAYFQGLTAGRNAFHSGRSSAPYHDPAAYAFIKANNGPIAKETPVTAFMAGWIAGWHGENAK